MLEVPIFLDDLIDIILAAQLETFSNPYIPNEYEASSAGLYLEI